MDKSASKPFDAALSGGAPLLSPRAFAGGRVASTLALWLIFFVLSLGLGYAVTTRFDPRSIKAVSDSIDYAALVEGRVPEAKSGHRSYRVLVPLIARPFSSVVARYYQTWNPVATGMLASNSVFVATTLLALVLLAGRSGLGPSEALLAAFCFATNFIVVNLYLVGIVDSAEACAAALMYLGLMTQRPALLLIAGVIGGLGKETFVVIGSAAAGVYWLSSTRPERREWWMVGSVAAMGAVALGSVVAVRYLCGAETINPFAIARGFDTQRPFWQKLVDCCFSIHFLYGLYWLLPLTFGGWTRLPRALRHAALGGAFVALALGVYHDARAANVSRPIFSYIGVVLCMAASISLARLCRHVLPTASH